MAVVRLTASSSSSDAFAQERAVEIRTMARRGGRYSPCSMAVYPLSLSSTQFWVP